MERRARETLTPETRAKQPRVKEQIVGDKGYKNIKIHALSVQASDAMTM